VGISADDRLAIHELVSRADNAASSRDVAAYLALFVDDAVLDGDKGSHQGKSTLQTIVPSVWVAEGPATRHVTLNTVVSEVDGSPEEVLATSTLLILTLGTQPALQSVSAITQHIVKRGDGWLIRRRSVAVLT
jgi:ketosteroid isomerase-like protein